MRSAAWPRKRTVTVTRYPGSSLRDEIVVERPVSVLVNGQLYAVLSASPAQIDELAIGHLFANRLIEHVNDIRSLTVSGLRVEATVSAESPPHAGAVDASLIVSAGSLRRLMAKLLTGAVIHQHTGGAHCAGIARGDDIILAREDVGRHNAIDKAVGAFLRLQRDNRDCILLSTGRINRETAAKAIRFGAPVMASRSAPTDIAIDALARAGITLVAFVRADRVNVYCHPQRIVD